jgi:hypothetical protein
MSGTSGSAGGFTPGVEMLKLRDTSTAGEKVALPGCELVREQTPFVKNDTTKPVTEQTPGVVAVNVTARAELAVGATVRLAAESSWSAGCANVMVCGLVIANERTTFVAAE